MTAPFIRYAVLRTDGSIYINTVYPHKTQRRYHGSFYYPDDARLFARQQRCSYLVVEKAR